MYKERGVRLDDPHNAKVFSTAIGQNLSHFLDIFGFVITIMVSMRPAMKKYTLKSLKGYVMTGKWPDDLLS
ncbi:MAG: hypothetical protein ACTSVF_00940 [Candidatus Asgardarchaeia archaeon]